MADDSDAKFKAVITAEDDTAGAFASVQRAFEKLGLSAEEVEKELSHLKEVDEKDSLARHFENAEAELRRMGLTTAAVKTEMEHLRDAQKEVEESKGDVFERAIGFFGRHAHREEGEGEGGEHGWESIGGHINILSSHFGELRENIGEVGENIGDVLPMLGAFGAIASVSGLVEMIRDTAEEQAQLAAMAQQLGVTANQLEAFHQAANMADVPVDAMDRSLGQFGRTVAQAESGANKLALAMFHKMGISLEDAHHHLLPMTTLLPEVAEALKNTHDPQMRLYVATELFGRAGREMLPLLIQGAEHLKELTEQAEKLGPALTDVDRDHLEQFNDAWKQAQFVSESFMTKLSADLAPVLTPLLDDFTRWAAANKDLIAHDLAGFIGRAATEMEKFPWQTAFDTVSKVGTTIAGAAREINDVVTSTVGWKTVLEAFAAYKLASPFAAILEDGARLLEIGKNSVEFFGPKLVAALTTSEGALEALNAIFERSPLGVAVLAAIAAHEAFVWGDSQIGPNPHPSRPNQPGWATRNDPQAAGGDSQGSSAGSASSEIQPHDRAYYLRHAQDPGVLAPSAPGGPSVLDLPDGRSSGFGRWAPLPQSPLAASPAAPVGNSGTITHHVVFENVPPSVTITTTTTGDVGNYQADVGYNMMVAGPN